MRILKEVVGNRLLTTNVVNTIAGPDWPTIPEGFGVIATIITMTSAAFSIQNLDRIRIRAGEYLAFDMNPVGTYDYFPRLLARFAKNRADTITDAATATSLIIPHFHLDRLEDMGQDECQLPRGRPLSMDLSIIGGPVAPTVHIGLLLSNQEPRFAPQMLGWTLNVAASSVNASTSRAPTNGILRAVALPNPAANNPTRWKINHARFGDLYPGNSPLGLIASQRCDDKFTDTTVIWLPVGDDNGLPTGPNELTIECDSGTTSLAAVEGALWQLVPVAQKAA